MGHHCKQRCFAIDASTYGCACDDGYVLGVDGFSCFLQGVATQSPKTCEQLGWTGGQGIKEVCSNDHPLADDCSGLLTYEQADNYCKQLHARLPTQQEILRGELHGSMCGQPEANQPLWASSDCGTAHGMGKYTVSNGVELGAQQTCLNTSAYAYAVCVADEGTI